MKGKATEEVQSAMPTDRKKQVVFEAAASAKPDEQLKTETERPKDEL